MKQARRILEDSGVAGWLVTGGLNSLLALLLGAGIAAVLYLLRLTSGVSVPLIVATVVATIAHPLVKLGDRIKLPRAISSVLVIVLILGLAIFALEIVVTGVFAQAPKIGEQLSSGLNDLGVYLKGTLVNFGISEKIIDANIRQLSASIVGAFTQTASTGSIDATTTATAGALDFSNISTFAPGLMQGASGIGRFLSGVAGGLFSIFIGVVSLFFILSDYERIRDWLGKKIAPNKNLGANIIADGTRSLRGYFRSITTTAAVSSCAVGLTLWILGVPLVIPIMIVWFLLTFIPFFGAFMSIAFACLIALGSGGLTHALLVLVILFIINNVLETLVNTRIMGSNLNLHPLAVLIVTLVGSTFAGLLGAMMGAPFLALSIAIYQRLKALKEEDAVSRSE